VSYIISMPAKDLKRVCMEMQENYSLSFA